MNNDYICRPVYFVTGSSGLEFMTDICDKKDSPAKYFMQQLLPVMYYNFWIKQFMEISYVYENGDTSYVVTVTPETKLKDIPDGRTRLYGKFLIKS